MTSRRGTRSALLTVVGGLLLAVGAPGGWLLATRSAAGDAEFGQDQAVRLELPEPAPPAAPVRVRPVEREVATRPARLRDLRPRAVDQPVSLRLPDGVADVAPVGVDADSQVVVPDDVQTLGWYRFGAAPGDRAGSAVLVGHVDGHGRGLGRFAALRELSRDDEVQVRLRSGKVLAYRVVAREQWDKQEVPVGRLFARTGSPRLVLLSCAGSFDARTRSYSDNVAVTAVPA